MDYERQKNIYKGQEIGESHEFPCLEETQPIENKYVLLCFDPVQDQP